jgi:hypothetical protein
MFVLIVFVVILLLIIVEVGLLKDLLDQGSIDLCCLEIVSLLCQSVSVLFDWAESIRGTWHIASKSLVDLTVCGSEILKDYHLSWAYEIAIGMAYPELSCMLGSLGEFVHDICLRLFGPSIDGIDIIYGQDEFNATSTLSRCKKARTLRSPGQPHLKR